MDAKKWRKISESYKGRVIKHTCVWRGVCVCVSRSAERAYICANGRRAIKDGVQEKMAMNEHQRAVKLVLPHQQNPLCVGHALSNMFRTLTQELSFAITSTTYPNAE